MNAVRRWIVRNVADAIRVAFHVLCLPILLVVTIAVRWRKRDLLIWGTMPVSNYMYWSNAMRGAGYRSETLMTHVYSINRRADFDRYLEDLLPSFMRGSGSISRWLSSVFGPVIGYLYIVWNCRAFHTSFAGGPLGLTAYWHLEAILLKIANVRTVVIPIGSDAFKFSTIVDPSLRHVLLSNYAYLAKEEARIARAVHVWTRHADIIIVDWMMDGIGRWDVTVPSVLSIDLSLWTPKESYNSNNGRNGPVRVLHSPNHRYFKGSEFLIEAVKELQGEGLQIELILLEGVTNETVRQEMKRADVLAEQFVFCGYGLSAVEGFASGLPVMSNLSEEFYTRIFRRYAFLNECPTLSTRIEDIKDNLRALVTDPSLREELGRASRKYAEKYHSCAAAVRLFEFIYQRILEGRSVDLQNMFHPLKGEYGDLEERIQTRLVENRLPGVLGSSR